MLTEHNNVHRGNREAVVCLPQGVERSKENKKIKNHSDVVISFLKARAKLLAVVQKKHRTGKFSVSNRAIES